MEKGILWLLLEAATIMTFATLWFTWRAISLRKKAHQNHKDLTPQPTNPPINPDEQVQDTPEPPFKALAQFLERQANETADKLKELRTSDELDKVTRLKLWGTLAKAERAILLNERSEQPKPILNRFMASIISTLESVQSRELNQHSLTKSLQELDDEFIQISELLITKEELLANQHELHQELHKSIDRAELKLQKLNVKTIELERLKHDLQKQQQQIQKLENHAQSETKYASITAPQEHETQPHYSTRHLHQLERLSKRQQAIIEHLQAQLKAPSTQDDAQKQEAQQLALERMERLLRESKSLIGQLQAELDNANLSISSLKQDISEKDRLLEAMDEQITNNEGGLLEEFQTLTSNKRNTVEALLDDFAAIKPEDKEHVEPFSHQEKEVLNLEQVLKESETCVQLLAQELESAEAENTTLREQIERTVEESRKNNIHVSQPQKLAELKALREENRDLVKQIQHMKDKLLDQVSSSNEKKLRNEYNKKSLELDRLQLAYSDLERKYLGTLR